MSNLSVIRRRRQPAAKPDRLWQRDCHASVETEWTGGYKDFLVSVTPGGGKTILGLEQARRRLATELRIVADEVIELDGRPVARLLPNLTLSLRDKLEEAFDALDEDEDELAAELEQLIRAMTEGDRAPSLAARMARARMRLVQKPDSAITQPIPANPKEQQP